MKLTKTKLTEEELERIKYLAVIRKHLYRLTGKSDAQSRS